MPHCFAAFISIGSIMPHALASGKPGGGAGIAWSPAPLRGSGRDGGSKAENFRRIRRHESIFRKAE